MKLSLSVTIDLDLGSDGEQFARSDARAMRTACTSATQAVRNALSAAENNGFVHDLDEFTEIGNIVVGTAVPRPIEPVLPEGSDLYSFIIDGGSQYDGSPTYCGNTTEDLRERLDNGEGKPFQLRDSDGEVYYTGRILDLRGPDYKFGLHESPNFGFEPLDDYGRDEGGATEIYYYDMGPDGTLGWHQL